MRARRMKSIAFAVGAAVMGGIFVVGPVAMIALNRRLDWPTWESRVSAIIGGFLILGGIALLAYCSRLFDRFGGGTPVPLQPPSQLVTAGVYRYSRNPIYVGDLAILFGLFLHRGELALLLYALAIAAGLQVWVVVHEEPTLQQRFGHEFSAYSARVPRWIGWPRA